MAWKISLTANFVVALSSVGILYAVARRLIQTRQMSSDRLGAATATVKEREQQALEINDEVVQGLATAQLALQLDDRERAMEAVEATLGRARSMVSQLLDQRGSDGRPGPGELRRTSAALLVVERKSELADARDR